ncbi:unnamed protein product [Lampetra fluviatilis]
MLQQGGYDAATAPRGREKERLLASAPATGWLRDAERGPGEREPPRREPARKGTRSARPMTRSGLGIRGVPNDAPTGIIGERHIAMPLDSAGLL